MSTSIDLASLGLTPEALAERVVNRMVEQLLASEDADEDFGETRFAHGVKKRVADIVNGTVQKLADEYVLPRVEELVAATTFQPTNQWGEPKKPAMTFREYLVTTAEGWMREEVNYQGKTKNEDAYNWRASNTRLGHMIHQHLDHHVRDVVQTAMTNANKMFAGGLNELIRMKINEVAAQFKIEVQTRR